MNLACDTLLPLLVYIQAKLDGDLSLTALGGRAGYSPTHFHRVFKAAIGETPRDYVDRLRLERTAFRLLIHDVTLLQIALDCGFKSHETFTRAFQRRFGRPPKGYRAWIQRSAAAPKDAPRAKNQVNHFELSATKVRRLRPAHLAFIRHIGPYEKVPQSLFDELEQWARRQRLPGPRIWMGLGHDAPVTTPPDRLRFDAGLVVPTEFRGRGRVGSQLFPGGDFAVTTHAGSMQTLADAYASIFPRVTNLRGYRFIGLPAVEIYHAAQVIPGLRLNQTDICLPVVRR